MTPRRFLLIGGIVLVTIGLLGVTGLLGSLSSASFFNPPYWINWFHLSLGTVLLVVCAWGSARWHTRLVLLAALVATAIGVLGLLFGSYAARRYDIPDLADPSDHLAHLTVGLLAIWALRNRSRTRSPGLTRARHNDSSGPV